MAPIRHRGPKPSPNHRLRRYWGMLVLLALMAAAAGTVITLSAGIHPVNIVAFEHVHRDPYKHASDPITLARRGQPANSTQANELPSTPAVQAIAVEPGQINLLSAGEVVRRIPFGGRTIDLSQIVELVDTRSMIEETRPRHITLKAALVTSGVRVTLGSPKVVQVNLLDSPSVFIGARGGQLDFRDITVTTLASDDPGGSWYQPFVMATDSAVLNAQNTTFRNLGWDSNASYGVSWVEGATGRVTQSHFVGNFIGAYTSESVGLVFRNSSFRDNTLYGLDPHTRSRGLLVDHVLATGNRAHGIIFSDGVTESIIMNSVSMNNGENGIMMDMNSGRNTIKDNIVTHNTGDGLVTAQSPGNRFTGNKVEHNRLGIRLDLDDTASTLVAGNLFQGNGLAAENIMLDRTNAQAHNGGQWNWPVVWRAWAAVLAVYVAVGLLFTVVSQRRENFLSHQLRPVT